MPKIFYKLYKTAYLLIFCCIFLIGCASENTTPISISEFKLNTIVTITIYDSQNTQLLEECMAICDRYELLFSRTNPESELYRLNHRELNSLNGTYNLSSDTAALIEKGLEYSRLSDGAFDITVAPLSDLWNFTSSSPKAPDAGRLQSVLPLVDYKNIELRGQSFRFLQDKTALDLGAVAKGFIADEIKAYLTSQGVNSAMINLGGNVLCVGNKPDGTAFKIGIQKPFADRNETIATMEITDKSVVSSGIYERFFEENQRLYHHLLNPKTGYPYNNGLISVTIISDLSVDGDGLSTACFALGLEKGMALIESLPQTDAIFITEDYEMHYSKDFETIYKIK